MAGKAIVSKADLGVWGERLAEGHLKSKGYRILGRRWKVLEGEIDLVAKDGEEIVFVEVKTRSSKAFGEPEHAITPAKRSRLRLAAWAYLEAHDLLDAPWRIDVIAIEGSSAGELRRLDHYENAVGGEENR
jgi:putative endonuclease